MNPIHRDPLQIQFNCLEYSREDLTSLEGENILHVKGFGRFLDRDHLLPQTTLDFILSHSIFVFDGDDLATDSFTKFIACFSPFLRSDQKIIAFKYRNQLNRFLQSWNHGKIQINFEGIIPKSFDFLPKSNTHHLFQVVDIYFIPVEKPNHRSIEGDHNMKFVHLGKEALKATKAKKVLCFGGGEIVGNEYLYCDVNEVHWFVYDLNRVNDKGIVEPPRLKTITLKNCHRVQRIEGNLVQILPKF